MTTRLTTRKLELDVTPGNYLLTVLPGSPGPYYRLWNTTGLRTFNLNDTFELLNAQAQLAWGDIPTRLIYAAACMGVNGDDRRWLGAIQVLALGSDLEPDDHNAILTHLNECAACSQDAPE